MDSNRIPSVYQKFGLRNNGATVAGKKETERLATHFKRRHLELGTDSSLECSSSSSDTDGELSKLREENRRLRRTAKHYRRKYLNAKERYKDVTALNIELQKRFMEVTSMQASYETPPSSVPYTMGQQHHGSSSSQQQQQQQQQQHHYVMAQSPDEMMHQTQQQPVLDESDPCASPAMYSNNGNDSSPEEIEVKGHNMFVECVSAREPVCELSPNEEEGSAQAILSEEKLQAALCVRCGQAGDSLFVKNLALAIWGAKTLAGRSVTGKRCMAIKDSVPKPPLSPRKVDFIKEKFIQRIQENESNVSPDELAKRVQKIRSYIADKIATLNRRST